MCLWRLGEPAGRERVGLCGFGGRDGNDADAVAQMARAREDHATGAAFDGDLPCYLGSIPAVIELLRHRRLIPVRIDVDDVVHAHLSVFGTPDGSCMVCSPYLCNRLPWASGSSSRGGFVPSRKV